ncbi:hypothetical protein SYJ56_22580 [Algoriphagus sp. D3-2-R+10]|uniref:hypothetical protein n=1 Tax=Algoriphagus aurantiacus TaxID=3103948 RepID=UPI002B3C6F94|nr:hypothetical protein [Algoriphagus sp. D3-2-R+10]MEB2778116.1 hypothetical protein [Algoriphagus sp. D3-2-R+10]
MKVPGILFLFLVLVASVAFWAGNKPVKLDLSIQSTSEISYAELIIQQSSTLKIGDALTNSTAPERPVFRSFRYYFKSQSVLGSFSGLSAICLAIEQNYKKASFALDANFPAFLIVFPHHYFT